MPYKKKYKKRPRLYGTKAKFVPRGLALKRKNQVSTKTFYFKASGTLNSNQVGNIQAFWPTQFSPQGTGNTTYTMPRVADSEIVAQAYTEYKVLAVRVRLFASNVGTETGQIAAQGPNIPGYNRGDTVLYIDQDVKPAEDRPTSILAVMNRGSCNMIPDRVSKWTKVMYRPKGYPEWGCCDRNVAIPARTPDPWFGAISIIGNSARPLVRPLWFFTVNYKIIFRGRNYDANVIPPPPGYATADDLP